MSTASLPARKEGPYPEPIDREAVLKAIGINARDPKAQALLLTCERYGLDPILRHMILIQGTPYVTRDGLLHVAHRSGQLDGIEVLEQGETQTHFTARVAVYRKDMKRPFVYIGRYPKSGQNRLYGPEMSVKCGEVMALRRAFDVALCAREEAWDREHEDIPSAGPGSMPLVRKASNADLAPRQPPDDWDSWVAERVRLENREFRNHQSVEGIPEGRISNLTNIPRVTEHIADQMIACGVLSQNDVITRGKHDKEKVRRAVAGHHIDARSWVQSEVEAHLLDCWRRGCAALEIVNPKEPLDDPTPQLIAEQENQEFADAEVALGREPGEDG